MYSQEKIYINITLNIYKELMFKFWMIHGLFLPRRQALRLCNRFGLVQRSLEKPGAHLPFDDPQLQAVRVQIKRLVQEGSIHERLVMNFDQVWSTTFRPNKKSWMKNSNLRGQEKDPFIRSNLLRRIRHNVERSLDLPLTEPDPTQKEKSATLAKPQVTGGEASAAMVDGWRVPRSVTTLSFIDGYVGRSFVTLRAGTLPDNVREALNEELKDVLVIDRPQPKSHVWNNETFIRYLDHLSQELGPVLVFAFRLNVLYGVALCS